MKDKARIVIASGFAAALLAGAGACSSGSSDDSSSGTSPPAATSTPAPAPAASATITITDFVFTGPTTVSPGATVAVTNTDSAAHTVTGDSPNQFDVQVSGGQTATFTAPTTPGTYPFHCTFHPNMHGTLIVK